MKTNPFIGNPKYSMNSKLTKDEAQRFADFVSNVPPLEVGTFDAPITSVADFLYAIEKVPQLSRKYTRGESRTRATPCTAGVLRPRFRDTNARVYDTERLSAEFYNTVFSRLTDNEREHFSAFAQHHGLPTALVDITDNPLVSLYFACAGNPTEDGSVYFIDDAFLDLTDELEDSDLTDIRTFIESLRANQAKSTAIRRKLAAFCKKNLDFVLIKCAGALEILYEVKGKEYTKSVLNSCHEDYMSEFRKSNSEKVVKTQQAWYKVDELLSQNVFTSLCKSADYRKIFYDYLPFVVNYASNVYAHLLLETFNIYLGYAGIYNEQPGYATGGVLRAALLPPIVYRPNLSFYRAERQQGSFLIQPYLNGHTLLVYQAPENTLTLRVAAADKQSILQSLDRININERTIYGDFDHAAKYILRNHTPASTTDPASFFGKLDRTILSGAEINQLIASGEFAELPVYLTGTNNSERS